MKVSHKLIVSAIGLLLAALIATFFYLYRINVGSYISNNHEHWATFGTLLSATFGLLASIFTFGTITILILQLQDQKKVNQAQVAMLEFDFYNKHKQAFNDLLESLDKKIGSSITFTDMDHLYLLVFPQNDYFKNGNKKIELVSHRRSELYMLINEFNKLDFRVVNEDGILELFQRIDFIHKSLTLVPTGRLIDGSITIMGEDTSINLYLLSMTVSKIKTILVEMSSFGGVDTPIYMHRVNEFILVKNVFRHVKGYKQIRLSFMRVETREEKTKEAVKLLLLCSKHDELEGLAYGLIHELKNMAYSNGKEQPDLNMYKELIDDALYDENIEYSEEERNILTKARASLIPF